MSNASGKSRFPIDAALILRDTSAAALTATTKLPYRQLVSFGAYWQNPADVYDGSIELVGQVGAITGTGVTLNLDVFLADDQAGTNDVLFGTFPVASGAVFELPIDQVGMLKRSATAKYFYVSARVAGTSPSVPLFAYLAPRSPI